MAKKRKGASKRSRQIKRGLDQRRQSGLRVSGKIPYGYTLAPDGRTLMPHDAEQDVLAEIEYQFAVGFDAGAVAAILNEKEITTRSGGKWHINTVRSVDKTRRKYIELLGGQARRAAWERREQREREIAKSRPSLLDLLPPLPEMPQDDWSRSDPALAAKWKAWDKFTRVLDAQRREELRNKSEW